MIGFRNPLEVALSLRARDRFAPSKSWLMYARSHLEVERANRHRQRIFAHYEQTPADWRPFSHKLRQIVGPLLPPASPEATAEIGNFLDRGMQHHRCTCEELAATPTIAAPIVEMSQRMCEASETGDESSLCESFDRLERVVTDATALFQGVVAAGEDSRRELADQVMAHESRTTALSEALAAEPTGMARVKAELEVEGCRAAELAASLEARAMEAAELRAEVAAWRDRTTRSEHEIAARIAELLDIRQSTSWRVPRPVRWVGRRIARARDGHAVVAGLDG